MNCWFQLKSCFPIRFSPVAGGENFHVILEKIDYAANIFYMLIFTTIRSNTESITIPYNFIADKISSASAKIPILTNTHKPLYPMSLYLSMAYQQTPDEHYRSNHVKHTWVPRKRQRIHTSFTTRLQDWATEPFSLATFAASFTDIKI